MTSVAARPIERLPAARRASTEQRESMNCKSCRKRKIKCNRLRPTCEACTIFQCACVYDAIPKKRGPKTDVLEALLKRVDGLEQKLRDAKQPASPADGAGPSVKPEDAVPVEKAVSSPKLETAIASESAVFSPITPSEPQSPDRPDILIDTYFFRIQDKPFHILDEQTIRQQHLLGQVPPCLRLAIFAVSARLASHAGGYIAAIRLSEEYAVQARTHVDVDEPSIEGLQTLLLIHQAFLAAGRGRKAYMLLSTAIGMAIALNLHREVPMKAKLTPNEREARRHLFWTCYLMDRFIAAGSKRPSLIADKSILLRLPAWLPHPGAMPMDGEPFSVQTNLQCIFGPGRSQGSTGMLIDLARILGITNRYLAAGGVKGDSHFPWHALSNLSKIRSDLDIWAQGNEELLADPAALVSQPDCVTLVLSKLIYHLIHCLIYRPFLPINLAELRGTGQHQSWQIEATNLCFMHANAIAELAQLAQQSTIMEWPAFIGYCLSSAGTVHVHGAHYKGNEGEIYSASAEWLSLEMQQLSELRYLWAGVQHQKDTLQTIYLCHSELVKSMSTNPMRFSPVFHLEDFFDRYPGQLFDGAHVAFTDIVVEATNESLTAHDRDKADVYARAHGLVHQPPLVGEHMTVPIQRAPIESMAGQGRGYTQVSLEQPSPPEAQANTGQQLHSVTELPSHLPAIPDFPSPFNERIPTPLANPFSPPFAFSPLPQGDFSTLFNNLPPTTGNGSHEAAAYFEMSKRMQAVVTPGGRSLSGSTHTTTEGEKDPFLTLLEQLAENEHSRGGPSDLDFYLGGEAQ